MDLSILKYCPHCNAPMTPTSYNFCIEDNENCSCCDCVPPENSSFNISECSICTKPLNKQDFIDKKATYSQEQTICIDCLKARRILQTDKEIYNCDFCGVELTQLDFLEDNAEIKRMLIVCHACKEKYFKEIDNKDIANPNKKNTKKKTKQKKVSKNNGVSETVKSSLKALEVAVKNADIADTAEKISDIAPKPEIVDTASTDTSDNTEKKTQKSEISSKSIAHRLDRANKTSNNMDYRAALGCLVLLVLILSAGIAYLIYSKYSDDKNKATEDLAFILRAMREKQDELADDVDRFGNRLYHLEQLEIQRSSDRINRAVDENDDDNIKVPDDDETTEPPDDDSTPPIRLTPKMQKILKDLDSSVASDRMNAIMDSSWENFRGATPKLIEIVKNDENKWVRVFAIKVLVAFREKKLIPVLKDIVFKEEASIVTEEAQLAVAELEKFAR